MEIQVAKFGGMYPSISESNLERGMAGYAEDLDLRGDSLYPLRTNAQVYDLKGQQSVYAGSECVITSDQKHRYAEGLPGCGNRVYRSGGGPVMFATEADAARGLWTRLGFPVPESAPGLTNLDVALDDEMLVEYTLAVYTYVRRSNGSTYIEESAPSFPTDLVKVNIGNQLTVSNIKPAPAGYGITSIRLYLYHKGSFSGGEQANPTNGGYFLAGEIAADSTSGVALFGEPIDGLTTEDYEAVPWGLRDITSWRTGQFAGLTQQNTLAFSIQNTPYAFRSGDQLVFYGNAIRWIAGRKIGYVLTDQTPMVVRLNAQCGGASCHEAEQLKTGFAIVSSESAAMYGDKVVYASARGLVMVNGLESELLPIWTESAWAALDPSTMIGCVFQGHYYGFTNKAAFRLKLDSKPQNALTMLSDRGVTAAAVSPTGRMVITTADGVYEMFGGDDFRQFVWRRDWALQGWMNFAAYRLRTAYQNAKVRHFYDGQVVDEELEVDDEPQHLPHDDSGRTFGVEIRSRGEVTMYEAATSLQTLAVR